MTQPTPEQLKLAREIAAEAKFDPDKAALLAIRATEARLQAAVEALSEELFYLSDKMRATSWLQDDANHALYERVVSAFQAIRNPS